MDLKRRRFMRSAVAVPLAAWLAPAVARAAERFPRHPVRLVVPFGVGGGADITFRQFAPYLAEELGVPVNVVNIPGGSGWVAWQQMAAWRDPKDDHMLGTINFPHLLSYLDPRIKRRETVDSFNFVAWHSMDPCIWAIRRDETRFHDLDSLVDYVKKHPHEITFSTTGVGSDDHMGIAYAEKYIPGFKVRKLYANGDAKKIREVLGGISDCVAGNVGSYSPYVDEGQLRFICILHPRRDPRIGSVPTFLEVTGLHNVSFAGRTIVCAPGLAEWKKAVFLAAIEKAIHNPAYLEREARSKNNIVFMKGPAIREKIDATADYVRQVRYWDVDI